MIETNWFHFVVALGLGLLIGMERERTKGEGPTRRSAGIRTFGLASLCGAVAMHLAGTEGLAAATLAIGALACLSYFSRKGDDPGLTTDVALILSPLLGGLAMSDPLLAASTGVAVTILLAAKTPLHTFVRSGLTAQEVEDGLLLAVATIIVWPQLPDRLVGPYGALNPNKLWLMVVLVLAIGALGHIASRLLGTRFGLPLAGFASGFVSSVATIGSMGARASNDPASMAGSVAGATLSTMATFTQLAILLFAMSPPTLLAMTPSFVAGGLVAALYGLAFTWTALGDKESASEQSGRAFSLRAAFILTGALAIMLVAAAALKERLGDAGVIAGAALAGLVDTHAAALSVASLETAGKIAASQTLVPILTAMSCNAVVKVIMAASSGPAAFTLRVAPGVVLSMAAAWLAAWF